MVDLTRPPTVMQLVMHGNGMVMHGDATEKVLCPEVK